VNLAEITREFSELALALVDEPALPSRSTMDDEKMRELVGSIRANGLLQPMIVARVGERYEVVAGHRRRIACARAGLFVAPCIVYPSKDAALRVRHAPLAQDETADRAPFLQGSGRDATRPSAR